jgi:outer membrane protein insertion porin family
MKLLWVRSGFAALLLAVLSGLEFIPLQAQVPLSVERIDITHVGPPAVSDQLIRSNIRVKPGDPYLRSSVDEDVRNLYGTGFFYNIRVGEARGEKGVILTYAVQGKPVLSEIRFAGNTKFSREKLLKKVTSKIGAPLDERKLFNDAQEIQKSYQKSGYPRTAAKYTLTIDEQSGRGVATFEITESPKVIITQVDFVGASVFTQKKLRKSVKTRKHWMFSWLTGSGKLKDEQLEEDREQLSAFYRDAGYIDFELKEVQLNYLSPTRLNVRFIIHEGVQYRVGGVEFKGHTIFPAEQLNKTLVLRTNDIFTPRKFAQNQERLTDLYGAKGYIDARIFAQKNANTERGTMDLLYNIDERQQSFIEKIEIKGNTKTRDKVIRRELAIAPGEVFDMVRVRLSTNRLAGLNFFEKVDAQPEPTDVPNRKNLVIGVEEKSTGNFTIGAGFSSVDNLVGFGEITQGNFDLFNPPYFTGGGQKVRLRLAIGTERQDYQLSFIEPWFLDRKLSFSTDLYHRDLQYLSEEFDERRTGGRVGLTKALGSDFLIGTVFYTLENVDIRNVSTNASAELQAEEGASLVSKVGTSVSYDTRNSTRLPDKGQRTELLAEVAGSYLGGDVDMYKLELNTSWYFKGFLKGHVLEIVGKVGVVDSYADSDRVRLFDRWFLGGLYTLRGFDYRDVGPKDVNGEPIGGNTYWFGSAEYSVPVFDRLRFAIFYDIGMVYPKAYSFTPDAFTDTGVYNDNFGFGLRLNLPIGPLRLDYGIPITNDRFNEGSGKFQFGVGYTRDF